MILEEIYGNYFLVLIAQSINFLELEKDMQQVKSLPDLAQIAESLSRHACIPWNVTRKSH